MVCILITSCYNISLFKLPSAFSGRYLPYPHHPRSSHTNTKWGLQTDRSNHRRLQKTWKGRLRRVPCMSGNAEIRKKTFPPIREAPDPRERVPLLLLFPTTFLISPQCSPTPKRSTPCLNTRNQGKKPSGDSIKRGRV